MGTAAMGVCGVFTRGGADKRYHTLTEFWESVGYIESSTAADERAVVRASPPSAGVVPPRLKDTSSASSGAPCSLFTQFIPRFHPTLLQSAQNRHGACINCINHPSPCLACPLLWLSQASKMPRRSKQPEVAVTTISESAVQKSGHSAGTHRVHCFFESLRAAGSGHPCPMTGGGRLGI